MSTSPSVAVFDHFWLCLSIAIGLVDGKLVADENVDKEESDNDS